MAASVDSDDNILLFTNNRPPQQNIIAQNINLIYKRTNTMYLNILASKS